MKLNHRPRTQQEWDAVRALALFLHGRLNERATLDWALRTTTRDAVQRSAILDILDTVDGRALPDPWRTAWRLVEEHWSEQEHEAQAIDAYRDKHRLAGGDRSGALIRSIVAQVMPRLDLSVRDAPPSKRRPKTAADLLRASLTSNRLNPVDVFELPRIGAPDFLEALARNVEGAVEHGIALAYRLGWEGNGRFLPLGELRYVAYKLNANRDMRWDVDEFHHGIAPSVKLLHATVSRLAELDPTRATRFVRSWRERGSPVHVRLWAAAALDARMVSDEDVAHFFEAIGRSEFWNLQSFPEIAELRARRFADINVKTRLAIERRLMKGPPRSFRSGRTDKGQPAQIQRYWALRELRRIQIGGGTLSPAAETWLREGIAVEPDLTSMGGVLDGVFTGGLVRRVPRANDQFDTLEGEARLRALEAALTSPARSWDHDPGETATAWIQTGTNSLSVLTDLGRLTGGELLYPQVLNRLGWTFSRATDTDTEGQRPAALRMLALVDAAPVDTLAGAIEGVTFWFSCWAQRLSTTSNVARIWFKLWPLAVAATNASAADPEDDDLGNFDIATSEDDEPRDVDTLNDPAGRMVEVFIRLCPTVSPDALTFPAGGTLFRMRESVTSATGKAGLIALHWLAEQLPYFLAADPAWAREHLINALRANDNQALALWRAVARRTQFRGVLRIIGNQIAARVLDRRLGRERRDILLSSLIVEALSALLEGRPSEVALDQIQQTIREVDDEIRSRSAQMLQRFLADAATQTRRERPLSAEVVFAESIRPFLQRVWPPERSLVTQGVSAAFAGIPASAGELFTEAVAEVEPFLVPFECWSMHDYGFLGDTAEGLSQVDRVDSPAKANALLRLLDLTVGTSSGAVVPMDLGEALDHISRTSPSATTTPLYRRLAALGRRR